MAYAILEAAQGYVATRPDVWRKDPKRVFGLALVRHGQENFVIYGYETTDDQDSQLNHIVSGSQPGDQVDVSQWEEYEDSFIMADAARKFMARLAKKWTDSRKDEGYGVEQIGWAAMAVSKMEPMRPRDRFDEDDQAFVRRKKAKAIAAMGGDEITVAQIRKLEAEDMAANLAAGRMPDTPRGVPPTKRHEVMLWMATPTAHGAKWWGCYYVQASPGDQYQVITRWGAVGSTGDTKVRGAHETELSALAQRDGLMRKKLNEGYRRADK